MYRDGRFQAAQCALPAYALLESGVPPDDPAVVKAADFLRAKVLDSDFTYELSLALLFLDRLGDPADKRLIRTLALRLLAGQHHTGGWSYRCPILGEKSEQDLLAALGRSSKEMRDKGKTREQALQGMEVPPTLQSLPVFHRSAALIAREPPPTREAILDSANRMSLVGRTDHSNTQFAMLGLWAAQRHDVPVEGAFEIMVARFERLPHLSVRLMGIHPGRGGRIARDDLRRPDGFGDRARSAAANAGVRPRRQKDVHVLKGLAALSRRLGRPVGRMDRQVPFYDLYFLWSVERVAMLYGLPAIGDKDWYRWGAESLLANQTKGGWWTGASPHPEWGSKRNYDYKASLSTAFALLFLKRSHPMKELTPKLPFTAKELNEGIARLGPNDKFPVRSPDDPVGSRNPDH